MYLAFFGYFVRGGGSKMTPAGTARVNMENNALSLTNSLFGGIREIRLNSTNVSFSKRMNLSQLLIHDE